MGSDKEALIRIEDKVDDLADTVEKHDLVLYGEPGKETENGGIVGFIRDWKKMQKTARYVLLAVIVDVVIRGIDFFSGGVP